MLRRNVKMINVAIDGPAGAGKSTIARAAAEKLGFIYVDTGALYRAVALFVLQRGIDPEDTNRVISVLPMVEVELKYVDGEQRVYLCGENVSRVIRTPEVSKAASVVSAIPKVRELLFRLQQDTASYNNVIMDGRDIGTVVLPKAQVKIFLTASAEERANRRYKELVEKGQNVNYDEILADIKQRDENDMNRAIAPLKQAKDAILIDNTDLSLEESVNAIIEAVENKIGKRG